MGNTFQSYLVITFMTGSQRSGISDNDFAVYSHGTFIFKIFLYYAQGLNALKVWEDLVVLEDLGGVAQYRFLICRKYKPELSGAPRQPQIKAGVLTSPFRLLKQKCETLRGKKSYFLSADVSAISDSCQPINIPSREIAVWEASQFCTRSRTFIYLGYLLGIFLVAT